MRTMRSNSAPHDAAMPTGSVETRVPNPADGTVVVPPSTSFPVVSYRSRWVRLGHVLLLCGGWALFAWLWLRVLERPGTLQAVRSSLWLLASFAAVTTAVTWAWIVHNVALARRRGGRRTGSPALVRPQHDLLGRSLVLDPDVARAGLIVVRIDGADKRFVAERRADA